MKDRIVATIEARMSSSRLPGKVLLPAGGKPLLGHLVDRIKQVRLIDEVILATTTNPKDDRLEDFAREQSIACYRGSEDDVLDRVLSAVQTHKGDLVVKFTGDCPIVDPSIIEQVIQMYLHNACDYVSNGYVPSFPIGMGVQIFSLATLLRSASMTDNPEDREHVTLHMYRHPEIFRHVNLVAPPDLRWPQLRLTVDQQADYDLVKRLIEHFCEEDSLFGCKEIIDLLTNNPGWVKPENLVPTLSSKFLRHSPIAQKGDEA